MYFSTGSRRVVARVIFKLKIITKHMSIVSKIMRFGSLLRCPVVDSTAEEKMVPRLPSLCPRIKSTVE